MRRTLGTVGLLTAWLLITTVMWPDVAVVLAPRRAQAQQEKDRPVATNHELCVNAAIARQRDKKSNEVEAKLAKPVIVAFVDTPLEDALREVSKQTGVDILIDKLALGEEGISSDKPVTLELKYAKVSAQTGLELLLERLGLTYVIRDGLVWVTIEGVAEAIAEARVYACRDLVFGGAGCSTKGSPGPGSPKIETEQAQQRVDALRDILVTTTSGIWESIGWGGGSIAEFDGMLVVRQNQATHHEVRDVLRMLRIAKMQKPSIKPGRQKEAVRLDVGASLQRDIRVAEIEAKLDQCWLAPTINKTPLCDFLKDLSRQIPIDILIDQDALSDEGIPPDEPLVLKLKPKSVSVRTALKLELEQFSLTYIIRDGLLWVTSQVAAEKIQEIRVYNCHDLMAVELLNTSNHSATAEHAESRDGHDSVQSLVDLVQSMTSARWQEADGTSGAISAFDDLLVIRQSQAAHREVRELLDMLRTTKAHRDGIATPVTKPTSHD